MTEAVVEVQTPAAPPAPPAGAPVPAEGGTPAQNPADAAPATPKGDETKPTTPEQTAEKRGTSRFERRISRLHREAAEARAERDLFKRQFEELKSKASPSADPSAPRLEDFSDVEGYATAKAKHESTKALKEHQQRQHSETVKQEQTRLSQEWESKAARGEAKYDDFDEIVGELTPSNPLVAAIMEAENSEEIAYHLAKNHKERERILSLGIRGQIREIGKLEVKLASEPEKPKTPSKAPAPITPLTGTTPASTGEPSEADDMKTWIRKRSKQVHGR